MYVLSVFLLFFFWFYSVVVFSQDNFLSMLTEKFEVSMVSAEATVVWLGLQLALVYAQVWYVVKYYLQHCNGANAWFAQFGCFNFYSLSGNVLTFNGVFSA